jgi:hypothetical protein
MEVMNKNLHFIREKCIAANPEIVELKFGCEFENVKTGARFIIPTNGYPNDNHKILGRPIRLADVLLAIENANGNIELATYGEPLHIGHYEKPEREGYYSKAYWNLRADDLEKQSEETISFLYELLK